MKNFMHSIGKKSKNAVKNKVNTKLKNRVLDKYISLIKKNSKLIIKQNKKDIKYAVQKKLKDNLIDRLIINHKKLNNICTAIKNVRKLKDPVDVTLNKWKRPNNLLINIVSSLFGLVDIKSILVSVSSEIRLIYF